MNRKFTLICMAPLLLGFNAAWADDGLLPDPAADEAHDNAQIAAAAAVGLEIAAEKTAGLPAEATIRLMNDVDDEDSGAVTHDVELPPPLPDEGAAGQRGLDTATAAGAFSAADDALDNVVDAAQNAAGNIEDRGRAEDIPGDVPGRPDTVPPPTP